MHQDLNEFIAAIEARGMLSRVTEPVSPDLEISAVTDRASKSPGGGPGLLFEQPTGYDIPVATNLFGSLERMLLALGVESFDQIAHEIEDLITPKTPSGILDAMKLLPAIGRLKDLMPKVVSTAKCQEVVNEDATLDELPILRCWPDDGGRYITFPLVITKDPETGARNIGAYRMQVYDGRTTAMHWQRHKGAAQHFRDSRITTIYEGTTGIQANDLIGRKVIGDQGQELRKLIADISSEINALDAHEQRLQLIKESMIHSIAVVEKSLDYILQEQPNDPFLAGSVSYSFLMMMGTFMGGWIATRSAALAIINLKNTEDSEFYEAKLVSSTFFIEQSLPLVDAYSRSLMSGSVSTMTLSEDQF